MGTYGFAVNFGVTIGISLILLLGAFVPDEDVGSKWLLVQMALPAVSIINLLVWIGLIRYEPIGFSISKEDKKDYKEQAFDGIKSLYKVGDDMEAVLRIYNLRKSLAGDGSKKENKSVRVSKDAEMYGLTDGEQG